MYYNCCFFILIFWTIPTNNLVPMAEFLLGLPLSTRSATFLPSNLLTYLAPLLFCSDTNPVWNLFCFSECLFWHKVVLGWCPSCAIHVTMTNNSLSHPIHPTPSGYWIHCNSSAFCTVSCTNNVLWRETAWVEIFQSNTSVLKYEKDLRLWK